MTLGFVFLNVTLTVTEDPASIVAGTCCDTNSDAVVTVTLGSGVSSPKVPCDCESMRKRRGDVIRQQDAVSAVAAVAVILNAPVIIVLRLLRCQKHVAIGLEPGRGAGVLHDHHDGRRSLESNR